MARPTTTVPRPWRSLAIVFAALIGLYAAVFAAGQHTPKLGIDLRGGTSVILTAQAAEGQRITRSAMNQAVDIIRNRVNGLGVSSATVTTQGNDNIVVEVPGKGHDQVLKLIGQTAQLRFRQVLAVANGSPTPVTTPTPQPSAKASSSPSPSPTTTVHKRALASALLAKPSPSPTKTATTKPSASPKPVPIPTVTAGPNGQPLESGVYAPSYAELLGAFGSLNCSNPAQRVGTGNDPANDYVVACSNDGTTKLLLGPAKVVGSDISSASASLPTNGVGGWQVNLGFKSHGSDVWGNWTAAVTKLPDIPNCSPPTGCNAIAIVLDDQVVSFPRIVQAIYGGQAQITGSFTQSQANNLAQVLKYGALPLKFTTPSAQTVSATLGSDQLRGGLIAGAIGLGLVVIYSLLYYRGLGLVALGSLLVSGLLLYAATTVLGNAIGYTLTLAGIAGFIVAVGITADSFVVYFERIRDELRERRTLRSGVERAWPRARRTILSADFVSLLAAGILYWLSVGDVRGFAFTLGLSTISDLFIVFLFTKPLLTLMSRTRRFARGGRFSGLGERLVTEEPAEVVS